MISGNKFPGLAQADYLPSLPWGRGEKGTTKQFCLKRNSQGNPVQPTNLIIKQGSLLVHFHPCKENPHFADSDTHFCCFKQEKKWEEMSLEPLPLLPTT